MDMLAAIPTATVARDEVMKTAGISWGCHISHNDLTAWSVTIFNEHVD
jgi:hypothetical protein